MRKLVRNFPSVLQCRTRAPTNIGPQKKKFTQASSVQKFDNQQITETNFLYNSPNIRKSESKRASVISNTVFWLYFDQVNTHF